MRRARTPWWSLAEPGRPVSATFAVDGVPGAAIRAAITPVPDLRGYAVVAVDDTHALLEREYRPPWAVVLVVAGLCGFLPGLFALAVKREEALAITASTGEGRRTEVAVDGIATDELLARLREVLGSARVDGGAPLA